ncbi:drug/metabolite transporter (DMT)-like permease [Nakamurella sp. UYEF19]|uniref:DMT family transporter n=1 Tax=Nakamurella sp. UYEF19 TaxID=1756392 RepID=UPI003396264C
MAHSRALVAGLGVVVLWASAFPAVRVAVPEFGAAALSLARLLVATVALLAMAPLFKVKLPRWRDVPLILGCGLFGMAAYQVLLNWGEVSVPAGTASMIIAAAPLVSVGVAAVVFREKLTMVKVVGSAVAVAGVAVVASARSELSLSSAVWILIGATIVQGVYHPMIRPLLHRYSGVEVATYAMVAGTLMLLPLLPGSWGHLTSASVGAWWSVVYLGVFPSAVGFVLWGYAVGRLPMITSTSLLYLVPAFAVLIAYVWLGEVPVIGELVGGVIVLIGVVTVGLGGPISRRLRGHHQKRERTAAPIGVVESTTTSA